MSAIDHSDGIGKGYEGIFQTGIGLCLGSVMLEAGAGLGYVRLDDGDGYGTSTFHVRRRFVRVLPAPVMHNEQAVTNMLAFFGGTP